MSLDQDEATADSAISLFISDWEPAPARLPPETLAWAIGDVHGQLDLFDALIAAVGARTALYPGAPRHLVLLGDYVDRGTGSLAALDRAAFLEVPGVSVCALWGNHETYLDEFLASATVNRDFLEFWSANGGMDTLAALDLGPADLARVGARDFITEARSRMPAYVRASLNRLHWALRLGGYFFVHAGIHPRRTLQDVDERSIVTMREPFLEGKGWRHDFTVVHGHSIIGPDIAPHRISLDSGAFLTGVLTAVELREDQARFIAASRRPHLEQLDLVPGRRPRSQETWRVFEG